MAPPRRGRVSRKQGSMPSSRSSTRTAAASSSRRRIPDIEDVQPIPDVAADQPELDGPPAALRWFPAAQGRVEYPRQAAPPDANNGGYQEIVSIHSAEDSDDEDVSDHIPRPADHLQEPRAQGPNDGQPGPSRKRQASVTLDGPVQKYMRQGPAASPSLPPPIPLPSTRLQADSNAARQQIAMPPSLQSGIPNVANTQAPHPVHNTGRQLDSLSRQMADFTSGSEHLLSTSYSLRLETAEANGLARENKALRARYDNLKANHKRLGDDHSALYNKQKTLGDDYRALATQHKMLRDDHHVLEAKQKILAADHRVSDTNLNELKKQNEQLKKENEALRKQRVQDLKKEQIAWCKAKEAKEAADAAKRRNQQLEEEVADLVLEIDIYEEIFIEEGERERARFMANQGLEEEREESEDQEESEEESEEELEEELEMEDE